MFVVLAMLVAFGFGYCAGELYGFVSLVVTLPIGVILGVMGTKADR